MTQPLWTSTDICTATGGTTSGHFDVQGLSINTRTLKPGDLFFALKGENLDGHGFVTEALQKGAVGVVVNHILDTVPLHSQIIVKDTFLALNQLATAARQRFTGKIIALTGSVGKTTTKETLKTMLMAFGKTYGNLGNFNNIYGLPLSLASLPQDAAFGVFEMGMNHPNEIRPLSLLAKPHVALVTNVHPMHIGHFDSIEGIAHAKAEIFAGLLPEGHVVLYRDSPHYAFLKAQVPQHPAVTFGEHPDATLQIVAYENQSVTLRWDDQSHTFPLGSPGDHWAQIAAAALGVIYALGLDVTKAGQFLSDISALKGRGQLLHFPGDITVIDESYNAGPESMRAAISTLKTHQGRRKIFVMGDMAELGEDRADVHIALAQVIIDAGVDLFFGIGPLSKGLGDHLPALKRGYFAETTVEMTPHVLKALLPGDIILLKGSRGKKLEQMIVSIEEMCDNKYKTGQ